MRFSERGGRSGIGFALERLRRDYLRARFGIVALMFLMAISNMIITLIRGNEHDLDCIGFIVIWGPFCVFSRSGELRVRLVYHGYVVCEYEDQVVVPRIAVEFALWGSGGDFHSTKRTEEKLIN